MEEILNKINEYYPQDENYNKDLAKELCVLFGVSGCSPEIIEEEYFKMQEIWRNKISASDFSFGWTRCEMWYRNNR